MKESDLQRIEHIADYCIDIKETIERFGFDYDKFLADKDYFKSVSMSIMQIGELSSGLSNGFKESTRTKIQWGLIKSMRNMFAHTYAKMDKEVIWEASTQDIPVLLDFCEEILEQNLTDNQDEEQNAGMALN